MSGSYLILKENRESNESTNGASLQQSTLKDESNHAHLSFFHPSTWMSSDLMSLLLFLFLFDIAFRLLEKALDVIRQRLKAKRHLKNDEAVLKEQAKDVRKDHQ